MPGVLTEDTFVEVPEGRVAVGVVGDDRSSRRCRGRQQPLGEPIELARRVAPVISAVATATFPLVPVGSGRRNS